MTHRLLVSVFSTLLVVSSSGCSWFESTAKTVGDELIDCAKADLSKVVASDGGSVLADVTKILLAGGAGWESALTSVGTAVGTDALACAVKVVETVVAAQTGSGSGMSTSLLAPSAASRAASFLQGQGYRFKAE